MDNEFLNPALQGKFVIKNTHLPCVLQSTVGNIDFRTLTEEQANILADDANFVFLERLEVGDQRSEIGDHKAAEIAEPILADPVKDTSQE